MQEKLGIAAPVRESGDIAGTPGCKLVGPVGECEIECGVIAAKRHIHLTPEAAAEFGVTDKQIVSVKVGESTGRATTFGDVVVRVSPSYAPAMHIDTDESKQQVLAVLLTARLFFNSYISAFTLCLKQSVFCCFYRLFKLTDINFQDFHSFFTLLYQEMCAENQGKFLSMLFHYVHFQKAKLR